MPNYIITNIMNRIKFLLLMLFVSLSSMAQLEEMVGRWITVDDETGQKRSIVRIYLADNGLYYGKIEHLYEAKYRDAVCVPCKGKDHDQPIVGLVIIRGMKYKDGVFQGGKVLDPESGEFYYGKISYDPETRKLKLRGSIDKSGWFGRSQYWIKEKRKKK